ncbi:hypothetical protein Cgig2_030232 [Carnegiea gigantea]|uniref:Uncharacterized protein n=1 Tax=Carnegiea gigantea TaxID=171969 RepID=A0A9Q1KGD9_9CARY|nr:hypothetical protein Cgig2_030232 [Carnegiea gigantea]
MLGFIYHGLGEAASHPDHLGSNYPGDFPTLIRHARLLSSKRSFRQARHVFRDGRYLSPSASFYHESSCNGRDVIDIGQLNNQSNESSKRKVKEQEILREEDWIRKIREDLTIQQQCSIEVDSKLKSSLYSKKREAKQVKAHLIEGEFSKLQDLEKEKDHLKNLNSFVLSFNNV